MNSRPTQLRTYGFPWATPSAPEHASALGEPTGSTPAATADPGMQRDVHAQPDPEGEEEEELSAVELTRGLFHDFEGEEDDADDLEPLAVAVHFDETASETDHADDVGADVPLHALLTLRDEEGQATHDPGDEAPESPLHFGFQEAPDETLEDETLEGDASEEDPPEIAALFGSSSFAVPSNVFEADADDDAEIVVGVPAFSDEAELERRDELFVEQRIAGGCLRVHVLADDRVVAVRPASLQVLDGELNPQCELEVTSPIRDSLWSGRHLVVLQGDGGIAWFQPSLPGQRKEPDKSMRVSARCHRIFLVGSRLFVLSEHGRCGWVEDQQMRWVTWPDRILTGANPGVLIASGRLGPYLVDVDATGALHGRAPLLDAPPARGLAVSVRGEQRWICAPGVGVWHTPGAVRAARRLRGLAQASALTLATQGEHSLVWLTLEVGDGVFDVVYLEHGIEDAVAVARFELNGEESSINSLCWHEASQRLFICTDESVIVLRRHHAPAP